MFWQKLQKPDNPEKREELQNAIQREGGLEKHDLLAMILAGLLVFVPISLGILLLISFIGLLPFLF